MKLHEFSTVIAGYTFRGAIAPKENGDIVVVQAKDIIQGVPITEVDTLTKISYNALTYTGHLEKNDVLLVARGMKSGAFRSTMFVSGASNVIASSSLHIIRITASKVLPEYVSQYLNSPEGQEALSQIVSGSYIGALPRRELEKILVPLPSLQKQRTLVNLYQNVREQQRIFDRKSILNQGIINATFTNLANE